MNALTEIISDPMALMGLLLMLFAGAAAFILTRPDHQRQTALNERLIRELRKR